MTQLHCYQYVNRPFEAVKAALVEDANGVFQRATQSAAHRAATVAADLTVELAGIEISKTVEIRVLETDTHAHAPGDPRTPAARFTLAWAAQGGRGFFPTMRGELRVYPLGRGETQLDFDGEYTAPLGAVGQAADALVGYRLARASVLRFLDDVAARLRAET
jgi:hypothetical protein